MLGITRGRCFSRTSVIKNLPAAQEIPESGRSPGEENGNPLQHPCLENLMITENRNLVGCSQWGCKESGTNERLTLTRGNCHPEPNISPDCDVTNNLEESSLSFYSMQSPGQRSWAITNHLDEKENEETSKNAQDKFNFNED